MKKITFTINQPNEPYNLTAIFDIPGLGKIEMNHDQITDAERIFNEAAIQITKQELDYYAKASLRVDERQKHLEKLILDNPKKGSIKQKFIEKETAELEKEREKLRAMFF